MPTIAQVGNELAEVPFGDLLANVAKGIADGQRALDLASLQTLIALSKTVVDLIPEVTEVITPAPFLVPVAGQPSVRVTGARVAATAAEPVKMNALQAGIVPTFYQFAEATIQLKMSIQLREDVDESGNRLVFGSTTGSLWVSEDAGDSWQTVSSNLPPIYAVRFAKS